MPDMVAGDILLGPPDPGGAVLNPLWDGKGEAGTMLERSSGGSGLSGNLCIRFLLNHEGMTDKTNASSKQFAGYSFVL